MDYNFVAIEGIIGAGKTTLAKMIANHFNAKLILEQFEDNSFLPKFYKDPERYAFPLEMSFLADRFHQLKKDLPERDLFKTFTVSDYFINKSIIFARRNLSVDEFALYRKVFDMAGLNLPRPDLLVYLYLDVNQAKKNIVSRGRDYELDISLEYLSRIQRGYMEHFDQIQQSTRVLIIDTNNMDFVRNESDFKTILDVIKVHYPKGLHRIIPK